MSGEKYVPDSSFQSVFLRCDNRLNRQRYILRCLTLADSLYPGLMLTIRRLHDLDKPSWWCIGMFVPIVNFLLLFFLLFNRGTNGPNRYGPDPLDI